MVASRTGKISTDIRATLWSGMVSGLITAVIGLGIFHLLLLLGISQ
jgi:hypothetical protein